MQPDFQSFADEMMKISEVSSRSSAVREMGDQSVELGKTLRGAGYGGGALALGTSFLPGIRSRALARRLLRAGALGGGLTGYFGEHGIRVGRGYQRAADVAEGLKKHPGPRS
jgi:hypothetical protein